MNLNIEDEKVWAVQWYPYNSEIHLYRSIERACLERWRREEKLTRYGSFDEPHLKLYELNLSWKEIDDRL